MSKRDNEGEVISNKLAVAAAQQHQALFASLAGAPDASLFDSPSTEESNDHDLQDVYVDDEQFGVGAAIPKDIQDGTFTRRIPASDDKLLQQLLGKKAAKAHIARQAVKSNAKPNVESKPQRRVIKEESEEEEEGRSSAFKSKRRKVAKAQQVHPPVDGDDDGRRDGADADEIEPQQETETAREGTRKNASQGEDSEKDNKKSTAKSRAVKPKARSYLDELLAERSNKKQRRKQ